MNLDLGGAYSNQKTLDLIVIDNDLEAIALRSVLEWWGVKVNIYLIGKSQDVIDIFTKEQLSGNICIASHGDKIEGKSAFHLPELGEEIAKQQPYDKLLFASDIAEFIKLNGQNIFSNACMTGSKEMADIFLTHGAKSYIAPPDAPFGTASLNFALNFYYWFFVKEKDIKEAYDKAMSMVDEDVDKFLLFHN